MIGDLKSLGEICEFKYGRALPERNRQPGNAPVFGSNGNVGWHTSAITDGAAIIIGRKGSVGEVHYSEGACWPIDTTYYIDNSSTSQDLKWLTYALRSLNLDGLNKATGVPGLNRNDAYGILLAVPALEEQRRIAAILDQADDLRRKRRLAIEKLSFLPQAIFQEMFGPARIRSERYPLHSLGELIVVSSGVALTQARIIAGPFPVYGGNGINGFHSDFMVHAGTIAIGRVGVHCGAIHVTTSNAWVTDNALIVSIKNNAVQPTYLAAALTSAKLNQYAGRSAQPLISGGRIYPIKIPVPPLAEQERYAIAVAAASSVSKANDEQALLSEKLFAALQSKAFNGGL